MPEHRIDVDQCQIRPVRSSVNRHVLDPSLPESLMVSRLPGWLVGGYRPLLAVLRLAARFAPELPVPLWAYLDLDRTCGHPETRRRFLTDPLGLRCYPLGFLAELVTADLAGMGGTAASAAWCW